MDLKEGLPEVLAARQYRIQPAGEDEWAAYESPRPDCRLDDLIALGVIEPPAPSSEEESKDNGDNGDNADKAVE